AKHRRPAQGDGTKEGGGLQARPLLLGPDFATIPSERPVTAQKALLQFSHRKPAPGAGALWPPHRAHRRHRPPESQVTGSVVDPGSSHVVAPSAGRGSWSDSRYIGSSPATNPWGCDAPRPTTTPGDNGTGVGPNRASPLPPSTTTHSSESGCVWA